MLAGLLIAAVLFAWGAQAVMPWRLRRGGEGRRRWAWAALPLLFAGAAAALAYVRLAPDAAIAVGVLPVLANLPGRLLALAFPAVLLAEAVVLAGRDRLENAGWILAAAFGLLLAAAAALAGELLRMGEGPGGPLPLLLGAAACRLLLTLAAGETLAPGRPLLAPLAGLALPVYLLVLLPEELRRPLLAQRVWLTLATAALLLLAARWVPPRLRRPTLAAGVLLASLALGRAAEISQGLTHAPLPPMPSLPVR